MMNDDHVNDSNSGCLESVGLAQLPLINDQQVLSLDGSEDRLTLGSADTTNELIEISNNSDLVFPLSSVVVVNDAGKTLFRGTVLPADVKNYVPSGSDGVYSLQPEENYTNQANATNFVQIIASNINNQSAAPPEGKVPISRISKSVTSASAERISVASSGPTCTNVPNIFSQAMLDLNGANSLTPEELIRQNLLLLLENGKTGSNVGDAAHTCTIPLKLNVIPASPFKLNAIPVEPQPSVPDNNIIQECQWRGCSAEFDQLDALVNHVNDKHVKVSVREVQYFCKWEDCPRKGRGFNARYKMLIHVRTHTKEKPHICHLCEKSFSRLENLKIHGRSHTGERPYRCPFEGCNKAYSNSSDRFKHVQTHKEDRPYICKVLGCSKRYTDPSSLRKHIRTHKHDIYPAETTNCEHFSNPNPLQMTDNSNEIQIPTASVQNTNRAVSSVAFSASNNHALSTCMPHLLVPQIVSVQGSAMKIKDLMSNPLLTSTILSNGANSSSDQQRADLSDLPLKDLSSDGSVGVLESGKGRETPLDLSSSPLGSMEMINSAGI